MARLVLLKPRRNLQVEAAALARLGKHIQDLKRLYEEDSQALAEKILRESNLSRDVKAVEVVETEDGFAIRFKFREIVSSDD